jgi:hypothetical protein
MPVVSLVRRRILVRDRWRRSGARVASAVAITGTLRGGGIEARNWRTRGRASAVSSVVSHSLTDELWSEDPRNT